eukprot:TRINITY_DN4610_c0_g1_i1.p1 TRINITY_DN4610_c0_g1~~TRINITY_DN4610_c0_g1_i1.p1  ORF type:complete len:683 (-),score=121.96 TRINITY_DN4610_c0_g1_i1:20-1960(-)
MATGDSTPSFDGLGQRPQSLVKPSRSLPPSDDHDVEDSLLEHVDKGSVIPARVGLIQHSCSLRRFFEDWCREQEVLLAAVSGSRCERQACEPAVRHPSPPTKAESVVGKLTDSPCSGKSEMLPGAAMLPPLAKGTTTFGKGSTEQSEAKSLSEIMTGPQSDMVNPVANAASLLMLFPDVHRKEEIVRPPTFQERVTNQWKRLTADDPDPPPYSKFCLRVIRSYLFEYVTSAVIISDAIIVAVLADKDMKNALKHREAQQLSGGDIPFTIVYMVELLLRVVGLRHLFLFGADWQWNVFDSFLVLSAILELFAFAGFYDKTSSILKTLRLLKIVRLLRVIRYARMFRELRLMLISIIGSLRSLFWAIVVILGSSFVLGVIFLQGLTHFIRNNEYDKANEDDQMEINAIERRWGSVRASVVTLYASCTGGVSWMDLVEELEDKNVWLYWLFLLYVAFFMFVIANTLTSLLLEATIQNANKDQQEVLVNAMAKKHQYIKQIQGLFKHLDSDKSSQVSMEEVRRHLEDPMMIAFMSNLGIDSSDVSDFFAILTSEGGHTGVDIDTFVSGCMKLRGQARSVDLVSLSVQQKRAWKEHRQLASNLQNQTRDLRNMLGQLSQGLGLEITGLDDTMGEALFEGGQRRHGVVLEAC